MATLLILVIRKSTTAPLSLPLVSDKSSKRKNPSSTFSRYFQDRREGNEQILILSKVLADEVNVGYHGWSNLILKSVNGHEPKNIQELVDVIVRKVQGEMIEFRCQTVGLDEADFGEICESIVAICLHMHLLECLQTIVVISLEYFYLFVCSLLSNWIKKVICMNMQDVLKTEQRILNRHMIASWCSTDALSPGLRQYVKMCMFTEADTTACCITLSGLRSNSALDWRQFQAAHGNVASRAMKRGKDGVPYTLGDKAVQEQTMTK